MSWSVKVRKSIFLHITYFNVIDIDMSRTPAHAVSKAMAMIQVFRYSTLGSLHRLRLTTEVSKTTFVRASNGITSRAT